MKKMYHAMIVVVGVLVLATNGHSAAICPADRSYVHNIENVVVNHSGEVDKNGCHEDGSGGYHCH